jgi:hypothetical protein
MGKQTSALAGGEWSASRPGRFTPGKRVHGTHWIGGWVSPRAGLDAVEKRKISCPCRESNPGRPAHTQPVAIPTKLFPLLINSRYNKHVTNHTYTHKGVHTVQQDATIQYHK